MKVSYRQDIKKKIATYYLESKDFNGISLITLMLKYANHTLLLKRLSELVTTGHIGVLDLETDENPHILRIGFEDKDTQVKKIFGVNGYHICIYPKRMLLEQYIERAKYTYEPYRLELALGKNLFDFLNFAPLEQVKLAISGIPVPAVPLPANVGSYYAAGGSISSGGGMNTLIDLIAAMKDEIISLKQTVMDSKPIIEVNVDPLSNDPVKVSEIADTGKIIRSEV